MLRPMKTIKLTHGKYNYELQVNNEWAESFPDEILVASFMDTITELEITPENQDKVNEGSSWATIKCWEK